MNQNEENIEIMKDLRSRLDKVLENQPESKINIQPKDTSKGHFYASLVKSGFRIAAGANLGVGNLMIAGVLLVVAEIVGIVEELV